MPNISTKNQEELSISYFCGVSAQANAISNIHKNDQNGIDANICKKIELESGDEVDSTLNFQIKSVYSKSHYRFDRDGNFVYTLKVKNYNNLVRKGNIPKYLVVLLLPENEEEWIELSSNELILRRRMYYISLKDFRPSSNKETVDVPIPKDNIFNCDSLNKILKDALEGEE